MMCFSLANACLGLTVLPKRRWLAQVGPGCLSLGLHEHARPENGPAMAPTAHACPVCSAALPPHRHPHPRYPTAGVAGVLLREGG